MHKMKRLDTAILLVCLLLITGCKSKQNITVKENKALSAAQVKLGIRADKHDDVGLLTECASWLGVPYAYGGNTKQGVDCSGFTCAVYKNVYGKKLHRRSRDQYHKDVSKKKRSSLKQGDLVFFTSPNSGRECGHVGIFLKEDLFIHASSSRGIVVDNLNGKYWEKHWLSGGAVK